jgi:hypothetical protein
MVNKNIVRAPSDVTMCSAKLSVTLASRNIHELIESIDCGRNFYDEL